MKTDWQMVSALATVVYTLGTFLLWWATWCALRNARDALRLNFLVALHDVSGSDAAAGEAHWIAAEETRRERTLKLMQRVFPNEWELLVPQAGKVKQKT